MDMENWNPCILLMGMQNGVANMKKAQRLLKVLKIGLSQIQQSHSWVYPK